MRVAALHADERGDLPLAMDALDVGGGQGQLEGLGITRHHLVDDVNLLEHRLHRGRAGGHRGHIHRPELGADAAGAQARDVRDQRRAELAGVARQINRAEVVAVLAVLPGQVVVAVNERRLAQ